jgi:hypothetical protein
MLISKIYNAPPGLLEKIKFVYVLLLKGKKEYEQIAATIPDKALSRAILTLAQESNQYANELSSQMQTLGGGVPKEKTDPVEPGSVDNVFRDGNEVLTFSENEKRMVIAYQEILNESFLFEGLRKMIRYQLNGILCAFMQLKLLNAVKFQ